MFHETITLFNWREKEHQWRSCVFTGVQVIEARADTATTHGDNNADGVDVLLNASADRSVAGRAFLPPKEYANADDPAEAFTLAPQTDFFIIGDHGGEPIDDREYRGGFFNAVNAALDGVYRVTSVAWFPLLPHFEIGGK